MVVVAFQLYDVNEGDGGLAVRALKSRKRPHAINLKTFYSYQWCETGRVYSS
jgi:hypothetical protein